MNEFLEKPVAKIVMLKGETGNAVWGEITGDITAQKDLVAMKQDVESEITTSLSTAKSYADTQDKTTLASAKSYADSALSTSGLVDKIYPVGSIYLSVSSTSPATLFGGTWEQIKDTFLLGAGDSYTAGSTGGEATHTLTVNEMPSHSHEVKAQSTVKDSKYGVFSHNINGGSSISIYSMEQTHETGGGQAHNNMPPYLTVYMWKRTA